jgi:hypothetical protein
MASVSTVTTVNVFVTLAIQPIKGLKIFAFPFAFLKVYLFYKLIFFLKS